ncbi:Oxysterol-binding protein-domain-containing protein [Boletus edulis BED1]|uniref:Oxysterol-binding protein-domain-containing protein n=1 Tax=Boletus edulis BED1 TaxID=1328754 RepID=A0AAD4C2M6_BOLED|nr:Oxysterol-binding protein-domain-containing protein [Boletus edulis BED1]
MVPPCHQDQPSHSNQVVVCEGWLLKKRRKKMQGFARRYFVLHQSGTLSYSLDPKHPVRDRIFLPHAALSTVVGRKDIHLDSSTATFHIKCLTSEDFNTWMSALRKFIVTDGRRSSANKFTPRLTQWNKSNVIAEDMGSIIAELESAITALHIEDPFKRNTSLKSKSDKEKHNNVGSVFSKFKKSGPHPTHEDGTLVRPSPDTGVNIHLQRARIALESLKSHHAALLRSFCTAQNDTLPPTMRGSPLSKTAEEKPDELLPGSAFSASLSHQSNRISSVTDLSDSAPVEWFDAEDNFGEEFLLEDPTAEEKKARLVSKSGTSSISEYGSASSDEEDHIPLKNDQNDDSSLPSRQVVRRTHLPSGPIGDEGSLFAMLKKNVGKDLSTIAFPVSFNEPLTLLQRTAEESEYHGLLQQASEANDPIERMCYVAAFAISGYAHTRHRSGRKGFNPMLAETFEDIRMKFIAEKVSHNPVVIAYYAEGDGWELHGTSAGKTKFWGKSLEIIPLGTTQLRVGDDQYEWNKPSSFMRNLMMGTKYLEHCGKMTIKNTASGASCIIDFKQTGYWGASNEVAGTVLSKSGDVCARIEGKWDEQVVLALDPSHLRVLWRITPFPKQTMEYYGFTAFGITLNEITSDLEGNLPPTDSRFRPDLRALEEGNIDAAEAHKTRLEELQRDRRRRGIDRAPRWFTQVGEDWRYKGGYWEERAKGWREASVEPLW